MTEYVQLKLRRLSTKPWNEMMRSSLVRNYLLLFGLLFKMFAYKNPTPTHDDYFYKHIIANDPKSFYELHKI